MNSLTMEVKDALQEAGVVLSDITTTCLVGGWYDRFISNSFSSSSLLNLLNLNLLLFLVLQCHQSKKQCNLSSNTHS